MSNFWHRLYSVSTSSESLNIACHMILHPLATAEAGGRRRLSARAYDRRVKQSFAGMHIAVLGLRIGGLFEAAGSRIGEKSDVPQSDMMTDFTSV
jgi:hypothetical protein